MANQTIQDLIDELVDIKKQVGNVSLKLQATIDHGRGFTGDGDCDHYFDIDVDQVIVCLSGDEDSESGYYE